MNEFNDITLVDFVKNILETDDPTADVTFVYEPGSEDTQLKMSKYKRYVTPYYILANQLTWEPDQYETHIIYLDDKNFNVYIIEIADHTKRYKLKTDRNYSENMVNIIKERSRKI